MKSGGQTQLTSAITSAYSYTFYSKTNGMDTAIVMEYVRMRMSEFGYGENYSTRLRHFVLQASEIREIDSSDHLYILVEQVSGVSIQSTFGFFDLGSTNVNELQYEHQGKIVMNNYSPEIVSVRFVQAIPQK